MGTNCVRVMYCICPLYTVEAPACCLSLLWQKLRGEFLNFSALAKRFLPTYFPRFNEQCNILGRVKFMCFFCPGLGLFLGSFVELRKTAMNLAMSLSVCTSVRMQQLFYRWTDFHENWYFTISGKFVEKIQDVSKSDESEEHFTLTPTYFYDNISLNSP